jgi:hypothetical protein
MKLTIELVPKPLWGKNLRAMLSREDWDLIRRYAYKKADYTCEVCGGKGKDHPVECHEVWKYDDNNNVQVLTDVVALCPKCHGCKHFGRLSAIGKAEPAIDHLCIINNMTHEETTEYILDEFNLWRKRSDKEWEVDITRAYTILRSIKHSNEST